MRSLRQFVSVVVGLFAIGVPSLHAQDWEHFRAAYPYHIQTIALSDEDSQHHRTLIISEPPPTVTLRQIKDLDPALHYATVKAERIGVDGWVEDVVIDLPPMDPQHLRELVDHLQQLLFGTSYKAYITPIPTSAAQLRPTKLNLHVTSGDLRAWVFGQTKQEQWSSILVKFVVALVLLFAAVTCFGNKRFILGLIFFAIAVGIMIHTSGLVTLALTGLLSAIFGFQCFKNSHPVPGGILALIAVTILVGSIATCRAQHRAPATRFSPLFGSGQFSCASILDKHKSGVFLSTEPGLVLWSFPRNMPLEKFPIEAREFALDSDLILGAASSSDQLAIIGRERTTPVAQLPPLRAETMLQLASAREDELAQSYERKNPLAGRYDENNHMDWAPIYLSPRLIDTEYGSLLNITDQLLKGWSMHNEMRYVNFKYPEPPAYPFVTNLPDFLGTKELTFNWNTKGVGYVTNFNRYEIYALNKTGSLPIDYLAEGKPDVESAEDTAYKYYSEMSDPNLVRVVQYAAIYQIFHHFGVVASNTSNTVPTPPHSPLEVPIRALLDVIAQTSDPDLRVFKDDYVPQIRDMRDVLRALRKSDTNGSLQGALVSALASRDGMHNIQAIQDEYAQKQMLFLFTQIQRFGPAFLSDYDRSQIRIRYAYVVGRRESRWIHTPSIVESQGKPQMVGGHNLSSTVTEFRADSQIDTGKVLVEDADGKRVIHYNPADDSKVGQTVRVAARDDTKSADEIQANVEHALGSEDTAPVSMNDGLGFDAEIHPETLRGFQTDQAPGPLSDIGWRRSEKTLADSDAKFLHRLGGKKNHVVLVARDSNGTYVIAAPPAAPVQASDLASSFDAVRALTRDTSGEGVHVHLRGFDYRQAEGFMRNLEDHTDLDATIVSTDECVTPEELAAILKNKYDISKAEIVSDPEVVIGADGHPQEIVAEIKIPAKEPGVRAVILRIRATIENILGMSQQALAQFKAKLLVALQNMASQPEMARQTEDVGFIAKNLVEELRRDKTFAQVRAEVKHDNKTLFYVHDEKPFVSIQTSDFAA